MGDWGSQAELEQGKELQGYKSYKGSKPRPKWRSEPDLHLSATLRDAGANRGIANSRTEFSEVNTHLWFGVCFVMV